MTQEEQGLARPAAVMAVGTMLSRLTGLGRVAALAYALGVSESRLADAYNIANTLPNVLYELALGGVLTSVFIPIVVQELRTREHDDAWESVSTLVSTSMTVLVGLSVVAAIVAPWVIDLFAQRLHGEAAAHQRELATFFLRCFAAQIAFYGFAAIAGGLLNAHQKFAVPMYAPILNNVVVIGVFLVFARVVHGVPTDASVSHSLNQRLFLGLGTTAGVAAMALVHWPFVRRLPGRLRARIDFRHPAMRKLARLSAWTLAYVVVNQIGFGIALYLANGEQGGPTSYFTAFAFFQLPYGIAAVSIMTALVPRLSRQFVEGDDRGFRITVAGAVRTTALLVVPATAGYLVLSKPLIRELLQRGVMRGGSTGLVSAVLNMFAIGLLPFSAFVLLTRAFYARQDARTPLIVNVVDNVVTVALDFILFPHLKVRGLALAHSLGYVVAAAAAYVLLARQVGGLDERRTLAGIGRVAIAAAAATVAMLAVVAVVDAVTDPGDVRALVQLALGGAAGFGSFLVTARALGVEDLAAFRRLLPNR